MQQSLSSVLQHRNATILQKINTLLILIVYLPCSCTTNLSYSPSPHCSNSRLNISLNASLQASNSAIKSNISLISCIPKRSFTISLANSLSIDSSLATSPAISPAISSAQSNEGSQYMWIIQGNSTGKLAPNCSDLCVTAEPNFSVVLQPCEGLSSSEQWLYNPQNLSITSKIGLSSNVRLCVDASDPQHLQLRSCNASINSQTWLYDNETMQFRGGLETNDALLGLYLMGQIRHSSSWGSGNNNYSLQLAAQNSLDSNAFASIFTLIPFTDPLSIEPTSYSSSEGQNLVRNGGFEECNSDPGKGFITIDNTQPLYLCSWYVVINEVEYSGTNLWQPEEGSHSLHLNSANIAKPSSITQRIATRLGTNYTLGFYMAGNPERYCGDTNKSMEVEVLPSSLEKQELWFDITEAGSGEMDYMHVYPMGFTAFADYVNLTFTSLTAGSCGAVIDNIVMQEITGPLPALINPHAAFTGNSRSRMPAYAKAMLGVAGVCLVITFASLFILKIKNRKPDKDKVIGNGAAHARWCESFELKETMGGFGETASGVEELTWKQIEKATRNFTTILGEGGFSTVYRAEMPDGRLGAVKMEKTRDRSRQIFKQELSILIRLRHPNLVNLIGFCNERDEGILVFEYMAHGSLHQRLHPLAHQNHVPLIWKKRMEIALQVAYALQYLHDVAKPAIVHGDIKSANVLLDDADNAKLCDFGFSSKAGANSSVFHSTVASVKGSLGYLDPQYLKNGRLSSKSDVYSFGVLLIELVTGLHAFDMQRTEALTSFVAPYVQDMDMMELIVDNRIFGKFDKEELRVVSNVAQLCVQEDGACRPTMAEVVFHLSPTRTNKKSFITNHPQNDIASSSFSANGDLDLYNSFDSDDILHTKHQGIEPNVL